MAKADSPTKTCGEDGCGRPLRARGLCITHYNQHHQAERHKKVMVPCGWCEQPCSKPPTGRYAQRFCSLACRDEWRKASGCNPAPNAGARARAVESLQRKRADPRHRARLKLARAARGTRGGHWVAGTCERCGSPFVSALLNDLGRFCSNTCKHRAKASRRRARERGARHERYARHEIFQRDAHRCHICRGMTDAQQVVPHPRAPTIDHLVPLDEGGDDTAANVATACFLCNSTKGNRGGGEQLALL